MEFTSSVGNEHEGHNAKNRKDKESHTNNLLDLHQPFLTPPASHAALVCCSMRLWNSKNLKSPEFEGLEGQEDMLE